MKNLFILFFLLMILQNSYSYPLIPDTSISPGDICTINDVDFQEYRYEENIPYCRRNVSYEMKTLIYNKYHINVEERGQYTIDHLIPLSIGGSNSELNLWPEHKKVKNTRPNLEICVYDLLRKDLINQKTAISFILIIKFNKEVDGFDPSTLNLLRACLKD
jgi:hypothetical protein